MLLEGSLLDRPSESPTVPRLAGRSIDDVVLGDRCEAGKLFYKVVAN